MTKVYARESGLMNALFQHPEKHLAIAISVAQLCLTRRKHTLALSIAAASKRRFGASFNIFPETLQVDSFILFQQDSMTVGPDGFDPVVGAHRRREPFRAHY
ncbi:hypothetical protein [Labrenzia sp. 011]|uniref:hypothetical protein n=1 Tax=Labrenzia sp. 011 TaxID=2171494 RepID=UPI001056F8B7|nr:hypothetical protein [Labrenzia sp. 011]